ncbi:hypothetical protein SGL43_06896 [Streptomyces globisporus]|uniref:Uncharacterized protein n=1 Tax=Streptomyces globisporus TaxID=1908 RepID=A0ABM9H866_STRGL|nr:hypothetical protein SGL43_06896 [Streptomyces globisporus]
MRHSLQRVLNVRRNADHCHPQGCRSLTRHRATTRRGGYRRPPAPAASG